MGAFYHVDREHRLSVGQLDLFKLPFPLSQSSLPDIYQQYPRVSWHGAGYLSPAAQGNQRNRDSQAVEVELERVRQLDYPDKPSRFVSFFAISDDESLRRLLRLYIRGPQAWLWEVEGVEAHRGDMSVMSMRTMDKRAEAYWSGQSTREPIWESLLVMPVTVVGRVACPS